MASTSETGLQLFARLIPRPSLLGLEEVLFPDGPNPKEVIELSGEPSCGKTLLFTQFIVKCILPKQFKNVHIGGMKAGVVLLNTDHHFQMFKLISMMESYLQAVSNSYTVSDVEEIVKDSLGRLIIYNISNSVQLEVTFHALQTVVSNQPEIGLILLDSICAFYWENTMASGIQKMDKYAKTLLRTFQRILADFKGVMMYTRPMYFQSKSSKFEVGSVNRKVVLKPIVQEDKNVFGAFVETSSGHFTRMFTIDSAGVQWVK